MAAVDVQNRVAKAQSMLPAEVTRVGVITQKRQTSMLLVFSLLSPDGKFEQEFIENYMKINVIPQIQRERRGRRDGDGGRLLYAYLA